MEYTYLTFREAPIRLCSLIQLTAEAEVRSLVHFLTLLVASPDTSTETSQWIKSGQREGDPPAWASRTASVGQLLPCNKY